MDTVLTILEVLVVFGAIAAGVKYKGLSIGLFGGLGVLILVFVFRLPPGSVPTSAILIILAVVTAAATMQVAGGVDWLVTIAQGWIRARPRAITFVAPYTAALFTMGAGTGNIYYSLLPVIEEVSFENGVRPERPLAVSPTAAQASLTASPVSSAMAAMVGIMAVEGFELIDILKITIPALIVGIFVMALVYSKKGEELADDPEYQERLADGHIEAPQDEREEHELGPYARRSAMIFIGGVLLIVALGLFEGLRPVFEDTVLAMTPIIQMVMLATAVVIVVSCKAAPKDVPATQIFRSGMVALIALFGVAWLANTFLEAKDEQLLELLGDIVQAQPWIMALAIFAMAAITTSQTSTTLAMIPLGLTLGVEPWMMIAMWPAVTGIYTFPINGSQIATMEFDRSGTTKIGSYVINHSWLLATVTIVAASIATGFVVGFLFF